jgi:predicted dehydrogenase
METVRLGLIGCGGAMARFHESYFKDVEGLTYAACTDMNADAMKESAEKHGAKPFENAEAMIDSGEVDLILIATPHFTHPVFAQRAFSKGIHVITEKPLAVTAHDGQATIDAFESARKTKQDLVFAGMFQQRTFANWQTVKRLCTDGSVGDIMRVNWTITDWFRTQTYYDAGGWRATWKGEGGGVLLNQCPHNLDLLCWFVGQPSKVTAIAELGKHHHIEVEDDVTAILQWKNGASGTFITSTGQTPGINRLEIVGKNGTVVADKLPGDDDHTITYFRTHQPVDVFTKDCPERFAEVPVDKMVITPEAAGGGDKRPNHQRIVQNVIDTILHSRGQDALLTPAPEGLFGLELGNAMLMSGLKSVPVALPMPAEGELSRKAYADLITHMGETSTFKKNEVKASKADMAGSF